MRRVFLLTMLCLPFALVTTPAAQSSLSSYRGVTLGDSVLTAVNQLKLTAADVKVVSERPTLVQQLLWRPHRFISGTAVEPDPLADMMLTFHLDRLVRIAVTYDRPRTEGLTNADLFDALTGVYGTSLLVSTPSRPVDSSSTPPVTIGQWGDGKTSLVLQRERYPDRLSLTIISIEAFAAMEQALAEGLVIQTTEAPARELARRQAETEAARVRDEQVRRTNKAAFKP
jgi:hypothetical protein